TRIKKLATGLTATQAADAFVRAREDPTSVSPQEKGKAAEFEATVEAMFLMAAVDGDLSETELAQLAASVDAFAALGGRAPSIDAGPLLVTLNEKLEREGWSKRLAAVAERLRNGEARTFAFRLAAGVAFADDHVAHAEAAALEALASALHITADESQEILYDVRDSLVGAPRT
ncbi:MAG: Tellurite resistance protein TerB, partial [Labilithrix sp.]|nr:Tellurite resistance protein TerB [Labilithrix sp.]